MSPKKLLRIITRIPRRVAEFVGRVAVGYEPAQASALVAAFFTMCSGAGLVLGDLPDKVDAVLAFVAVVSPLIAGRFTRRRVTPMAKLRAGARRRQGV